MSDMLAVLLGAGGGKASKAIADLAGGKFDAKHTDPQAAGADPFLAVLVSRLGVSGRQGGQAVGSVSPLPGSALPLPASAAGEVPAAKPGEAQQVGVQGPLKPLEAALMHGQPSAAEAAYQAVVMAPQVQDSRVLAAPAGGADAPDFSTMMPGRRGVRGEEPIKASLMAALAQSPAKSAMSAAGRAADGQLLPLGQGEAELPPRPLRADIPQPISVSVSPQGTAPGLVLPSQTAGAEALGLAPGQAAQSGVPGLALPMGATGEAQARTVMSGPMQLAVDAPLRSPQFPQELGERVVWLAGRQGQVAEIALNPPHLGPLEVRLSLSGGEAGAQFFSPHPLVRDAIEAALPKLREMLAEAGVTLGQAQVRDETLSRQGSFAQGDERHGAAGEEGGPQNLGVGAAGLVVQRMGRGLVDLYI